MSYRQKKYHSVKAQLISENETHWILDILESTDGITKVSKMDFNYNYEEELLEGKLHLLEGIIEEEFI